jgi:tetratricopeptide (TPR) repeat protein
MGAGSGTPGLDPGRVAQLRIERTSGDSRGSGYRLSDTAVLTAAHVVADARAVQVVFNPDLPDEWSCPAAVEVLDQAGDVAVLTIDVPRSDPSVEPAQFGQVGRRSAVLPCRAVGFPRFKLRTGTATSEAIPPYRDAHQVDGTISSLSNWREGTLEITVPVPPDPDPEHSPWEGMSGAPVWCGDLIVGVISRHHRSDGLGRLAAVRTDRWYEQLGADRLARLHDLAGLAASVDQLVDVIPREPAELVAAAYREQIEDIAPLYLEDREEERAELTAFCAGDDFYAWWQAGPWAGKTALTSWFALHPPVGVNVVSFFITRRLAGQADSSAFTEALVEQLAVAAGEPDVPSGSPAGRDGQRRRLLKKVAAQLSAAGRRLLLLVDGLDEDEGVPPAGPSSIAALLPRRPIEGLRVGVTSRPHPGLPHDVPPDHPLRQFRTDHPLPSHRPHELAPSPLGEELKVLAKTELIDHLHGADQLAKDIIGYIAAAGGGLTLTELGELAPASYLDLQTRISGVFGRTLGTRTASDVPPGSEAVYLFAHETLREIADEQLGYDVHRYESRIHQWADSYRQQGWPDRTPRYLGRPYTRLLTRTRDLSRLIQVVTDPRRHERMLATTGTDTAALAEIPATQQLLLEASDPDLHALGMVAVERYRLSQRSAAIPPSLPALWVRLGRPDHGQSLALSITDPNKRVEALIGMAKAWAAAGQVERAQQVTVDAEQVAHSMTYLYRKEEALARLVEALVAAGQEERAEQVARSITDPRRQGEALTRVAEALVAAGQLEQAEQVARTMTDPYPQGQALARLAEALVAAGQLEQAEQVARSIIELNPQGQALARLAEALVAAGQLERAEQVAYSITDRDRQPLALALVAHALAEAGQKERAERAAVNAEQVARSISIPAAHGAWMLALAAGALAAAGQEERAAHVARSINYPDMQVLALTRMAEAFAAVGQEERAEQAAVNAEQVARSISDPDGEATALARVARMLVVAGQQERAEQVAYSITDRDRQAEVLTGVVEAWLATGQQERAERVARGITDLNRQAEALVEVAEAFEAAGQRKRAEQVAVDAERVARSIGDPHLQVKALALVAEALAAAGQHEQAKQVAVNAERVARSITDLSQVTALLRVAEALAVAGQLERAEQVVRSIIDRRRRGEVLPGVAEPLARVAEALAAAGQQERAEQVALDAEQVARIISDRDDEARALARVARMLVVAGQQERAEQVARSITDPYGQTRALAQVAEALAAAGQQERAGQVALDAEQVARSIDSYQRPYALARAAEALAAAGQQGRAGQVAVDAEQVARSITDPYPQAEALARVAGALAAAGQQGRAGQVALDAEQVARSNESYRQPDALTLARVAEALVAVGQRERAEQLARSISPYWQASLLVGLAGTLAREDVNSARARSRTIVAEILATDLWYHAMPVLASLDLEATTSIGTAIVNI